jgi:dTDP-4-dehydrorhamnose 3,5-epimerase
MTETFRTGEIAGVIARGLSKLTDSRGWLTEIFRNDELDAEFHPAMAYVSSTFPGVTRGPHEHFDQADLFCFIGPSTFKLRLWDNRVNSPTFRVVTTLLVGENNPMLVLVPSGVVHAYQNVGGMEGIVINCPNRLYAGKDKAEPVDEIRHENNSEMAFLMD